jgi:quercetin dioxygenase-like cupin family protein
VIEKEYSFKTSSKTKLIEKIISDENLDINHVFFNKGEALPEHYSNSNVYLIVISGSISVQLNDQNAHIYNKGAIVNVPYKTKMNISNQHDEILEFFIIKAPSPRSFNN